MALPPLYQTRGPAAAMPLPAAATGAVGETIGAGLAAVGGAGLDAARLDYQRDYERQAASFGVQAAQARERFDARKADLQQNLGPGGAGYEDAVHDALEQERERAYAGITSPEALQRANGVWATFAGGERAEAHAVVAHARGQQQGDDLTAQLDAAANRAARADDVATPAAEAKAALATIDAWAAPAGDKQRASREATQHIFTAWGDGVAERNPQALLAHLDSGALDQLIPPPQGAVLRRRAEAEIARQQTQARMSADAAERAERESVASDKAALEAGSGNPGGWLALAARQEALGDSSSAVASHARADEAQAAIGYRGQPLAALSAKRQELAAKEVAQGGLDAHDGATARGLDAVIRDTSSRVRDDPLAASAWATGRPVPPLVLTDPSSIAARVAYARQAQAHWQTPSLSVLTPDEAHALQGQLHAKEGSERTVLAQLAAFGDAAPAAARQVAPDDRPFQQLAGLATMRSRVGGAAAVADVYQGRDALKARPDLWNKDIADDARELFDSTVAGAFQAQPGAQASTFELAKAMYAAKAFRSGAATTSLDKGLWTAQISRALGAVRVAGVTVGGIATVRDRPTVLPDGWSKPQLETTLARAGPADWQRASGSDVPVWSDGRSLTLGEARGAAPVWLGGSRYGLLAPGGLPVQGRRGGAYTFDVAQLAPR